MESNFKKDVIDGLSQPLKKLSSKYFYDEKGDKLFQEIMQLEEYYLPRCEREIIDQQTKDIVRELNFGNVKVDIVELGAGDGSKTVELLLKMHKAEIKMRYVPLDISSNILEVNQKNISQKLPDLEILPIAGDYLETMGEIANTGNQKLILFLGGNIGNFTAEAANAFLRKISTKLAADDFMLIAFDLRKNPHTILHAYNDSEGITKKFNLNILERINRELDADFNLQAFDHYAVYEPVSGRAASYLVSLKKQFVRFSSGEEFLFGHDEIIHTEISKKYSLEEIIELGEKADLKTVSHFLDNKNYYTLSLFKKMDS